MSHDAEGLVTLMTVVNGLTVLTAQQLNYR